MKLPKNWKHELKGDLQLGRVDPFGFIYAMSETLPPKKWGNIMRDEDVFLADSYIDYRESNEVLTQFIMEAIHHGNIPRLSAARALVDRVTAAEVIKAAQTVGFKPIGKAEADMHWGSPDDDDDDWGR